MVDIENIWKKESLRAERTSKKWETAIPKGFPKAIRYIVGFKHEIESQINFKQFSRNFPLEKRVEVINNFAPIGWSDEYDKLSEKTNQTPHFDEKGNYNFSGHPAKIYSEDKRIKRKLKPISLKYVTKDSDEMYKGVTDIGNLTKTLIFYNDKLVAQIILENYKKSSGGSDAAPYADLVINFTNGKNIKQNWSAWEGNTLEYLEERLRKILGEPINSFELIGEDYA